MGRQGLTVANRTDEIALALLLQRACEIISMKWEISAWQIVNSTGQVPCI